MNVRVVEKDGIVDSRGLSASITSPEHGAQQECSSSLFAPFGSSNLGRLKSAIVINIFIGVMKIAQSVASEQGYRE